MNRKQRRAEKAHGGPAPQAAVQAEFTAALRHHQAGRLKDAERLYRRVLTVDARHADSLHLLGVLAHHEGRHDVAVDLIGKAIAINGSEAAYHSNLGTALWKQGRLDLAAACYRRALELRPDYAKAHFNLATVLWKHGRPDDAMAGFHAALAHQPDYPEAHDNLGTVLKEQGRTGEAIACYHAALRLRPTYPEAHNNLGTALLEQGRADAAVVCYREAIALRPNYPEAHFNLGTAMLEQGDPDAAAASFRTALSRRPDYPDALLNLGTTLKQLGRLEEATACYREVLAREPDHPEAHSNLGIVLLAQGRLEEGLGEHEWRWRTPQMLKARRGFTQPQWRGEPAKGLTLLIHAEQGFGDTLQFCRYAPLAAARGLRVILEVQQPLVRLLRGLPGVDQVVAHGEAMPHVYQDKPGGQEDVRPSRHPPARPGDLNTHRAAAGPPDEPGDDAERGESTPQPAYPGACEALPAFDLHCPMLSLPLALGTTLATIPDDTRYLHADPAKIAAWRTRLPARGPRIGLAWAGNPRGHSRGLAAVDRRRSMAPELLAPLFELPGVNFFSLQKGGPAAPGNIPLTDVMAEMDDFADTAALVANLDLVISVDTAVVHLAGALGRPVWLLDRFDPCWRWLTGRRDSPWYPGLRIYRQPRPGDWEAVVSEVVRDLHCLGGDRTGPTAGHDSIPALAD